MNPHGRQQDLEEKLFKPVNDILGTKEQDALHFDSNSEEAALAMQRKNVVELMEVTLPNTGLADSIGSIREILTEIRDNALDAWYGREGGDYARVMRQFNNFVEVVDKLSEGFKKMGLDLNNLDRNTPLSNEAVNAIKEACEKLQVKFPRQDLTVTTVKPRS